jgi:hypothetical protein
MITALEGSETAEVGVEGISVEDEGVSAVWVGTGDGEEPAGAHATRPARIIMRIREVSVG